MLKKKPNKSENCFKIHAKLLTISKKKSKNLLVKLEIIRQKKPISKKFPHSSQF